MLSEFYSEIFPIPKELDGKWSLIPLELGILSFCYDDHKSAAIPFLKTSTLWFTAYTVFEFVVATVDLTWDVIQDELTLEKLNAPEGWYSSGLDAKQYEYRYFNGDLVKCRFGWVNL